MMTRLSIYLMAITAGLAAIGCTAAPTNQPRDIATASPSPSASVSTSPANENEKASNEQPLTLPVLDAFFADESFSDLLKKRLQVTDEQVAKLKELAHSETAKLNETNAGKAAGESAAARTTAEEKISGVIGEEKTQQLAALVRERWSAAGDNAGEFATRAPNAVPTDSRIVVNTPAYRMDVFEDGKLVKSYKVGIGYPQFPLPTGLRKARTIIFNPTWTPPDEPWVAKMKNINVGEKVEAGSKLNPLGPIKVPIGGPSLIHGGKSPAKLGTFASHGCVGLTTPQVQDFVKLLAQLGGARLTDADIADYARNKTQTKQVKLNKDVPVELRYETIVVEDGELHIYRDVYDQGVNTEDNLRAVLAANGVKLEDLTEEERAQVMAALAQMAVKSQGAAAKPTALASQSPLSSAAPNSNSSAEKKTTASMKKPRADKNQKEVVIEIAALKGKGYPPPVDFDTGNAKPKTISSVTKPGKRPQ